MNYLAANIAAIRRRWDLNQTDFATLLNATRIQVSNWERGRSAPGAAWLLRLAQLSGIDIHRLHGQELPGEAIPEQPGHAPPVGADHSVLEEIQAIRARLDAIEGLLLRLLPPSD